MKNKTTKYYDSLYDDSITRDKKRVKQNGEIFTPDELVNEVLDGLDNSGCNVFKDASLSICEPCFGNGQFIIQILKRRLKNGIKPLDAMATLYGLELMPDNVAVTHKRVLKLLGDTPAIRQAVKANLIQGDMFTFDFISWEPETFLKQKYEASSLFV